MSTIKEELEKLLELQEIDNKLQDIKILLKELPEEIKAIEKGGITLQNEMEEFKKTFMHMKIERRQKETEHKAVEDQIKNLQSKLYEVKTNKEYQALQEEIKNLTQKLSSLEDEILGHMEKEELLKEKEKDILKKIEEHKNMKNEKQKVIEEKINQLEQERNDLQKKREECVSGIDKLILELYIRVKKSKKDGVAISRITQDSSGCICGGCYVYIPGYLIEKVKRKTEAVQCENCGRILSE
ncbi:MAG: C4-type zinc ribbon domain-containing protein [Candidatus Omnitrophica bacterium]|nr:C4-type zinc ribbon domain-containing protein [Candidatus Omnitrophota bacterium]MCM8828931.1 C4-type zinc ribbon domain-containing protein [Candidatus Omnitrophota bacterium]